MQPDAEDSVPRETQPTHHQLRRVIQFLLIVLWADALFKFGFYVLYQPLTSPASDYLKHWEAAKAVLAGRTPYYGAPDLYLGFNYPMFTAYAFSYLGFLDFPTSKVVWTIGNAIFLVLGVVVAAVYLRPAIRTEDTTIAVGSDLCDAFRRHWVSVVVIATLNFHPLIRAFTQANIDPFEFLLLVIFAAALVKKCDGLAGGVLAAVTLVKVVPILLLVPLVAVRRWRVIGFYLGGLLLYALILLLTGKWRMEAFLYADVLPKIGFQYLGISYSTHKMLAILWNPAALTSTTAYNQWVFAINAVLMLVMCGVCAYAFFRRRAQNEHLVAFGTVMLALMSPLLEYHHFVWAVPAYFLQMKSWAEGTISNRLMLLCVLAWVGLFFVRILNDFVSPLFSFPYLSFSPLAGAVLAAVTAAVAFNIRDVRS